MANSARRPLGPGGGTTKTVLTLWALLFLIAAAKSQPQSQDVIRNLHSYVSSTKSTTLLASDRPQPGRSPAEIPLLKLDTTTIKLTNTENQNTNEDDFQALAPADNAVRAPLARSGEIRGETSGLSSLTPARLLQDWEVENIVLLATIDGAIHARDRKTGQERWSLSVPDSPMIETTHHRSNRSSLDESRPEDEYIFIVEPSKDGDLYIQHKDPRVGLQRLGFTVRSLAATTPSWIDEPPLVTTAKVDSTLFTIDAASGNVLRQFSPGSTFVNDDQQRSCRPVSGFEPDNEACEPFGTLHIGRNQYTVTITSANTGNILCTIKYAEWIPNTRDGDLQSQHVSPSDSCHIQSYHNGRIIGLDSSQDRGKPFRFTHVLDTPVARVYDVFRPADNKDGSAPLVMLSQPIDPRSPESHLWNNDLTRSRVFVNRTESGHWYALSELSYPGVTSHAPHANLLRDLALRQRDYLDFDENIDDIIGVQTLSAAQSNMPIRATIDAPPSDPNNSKGSQSALIQVEPPLLPSLTSESLFDVKTAIITILTGFVAFMFLFRRRPGVALQLQNYFEKAGWSINVMVPLTEDPISVAMETASPGEIPGSQPQPESEAVGVPLPGQVGMQTPPRSRSQSSAQGLVLTKALRTEESIDNSSDGESDDEGFKLIEHPDADGSEPKKKKAKRGKRGGKNNKKKKQMSPEAMDEDETVIVSELPAKDGMLQVGRLKLHANPDRCLGHGSNGTTVFPGILDGREVAVKRLLRSSTSLAAKEIKHLLSSDENPHVIRYFGKEESPHFTYIALDLFTASLDQLIEHPEKQPSLVDLKQGFDVKDALKQITDGVQHLHSLKLVHRDIKPQNVLVRAVKSSRPGVGMKKLQIVISDFGLCKPLEEGPESTFAPTMNHTAAGTTGWRAPELLVNSRASVAAPSAASTASKSTSHSSDGTVIDPSSGRRATKAIDIFSLGCVFYYVMTQGQHPFDVGGTSLGRDLNIKENRFDTKGLEMFDYEYDAEDLVMQMINHNPKLRPDTQAVLRHPYFWNVEDKLDFLCDVSDCYEREKNTVSHLPLGTPPSTEDERRSFDELQALESLARNVIGESNGQIKDFLKALPRSFINGMGRQRTYTGSKMIDLLRLIRNKKNHFHDLPEDVKEMMLGGSTTGYFRFWAKRFPSLVINCHCLVLERDLKRRFGLAKYYT